MVTLNIHDLAGWLFLILSYFLPGYLFSLGPTAKARAEKSGRERLAWTLLFWPIMFFYIPYRTLEAMFSIICEGWGPYRKRRDAEENARVEREVREWMGLAGKDPVSK